MKNEGAVLVEKRHLKLINCTIGIATAEIIAASPIVKPIDMSGGQLADPPSRNLLAVIMASVSDASMNGAISASLCCLYNVYPIMPVDPATTSVATKYIHGTHSGQPDLTTLSSHINARVAGIMNRAITTNLRK